MKVKFSLLSAIFEAKPWLMIAEYPLEIYGYEADPMGDPDWDIHPLHPRIEQWLDMNIPKFAFSVSYEETGPGRGVYQEPYVAWNRPVKFMFRKDAIMFKLAWDRK